MKSNISNHPQSINHNNPNKCLEEMLILANEILARKEEPLPAKKLKLAMLVELLDKLLTNGEAIPSRWKRHQPTLQATISKHPSIPFEAFFQGVVSARNSWRTLAKKRKT